jgi:hypothetical protein
MKLFAKHRCSIFTKEKLKMKKLTLMATTALIIATTPVMANENQGWLDSMTSLAQQWWAGNDAQQTEVEAYLDQVTIAVPPMNAADAAAIQPAAGDYIEDVQTEMNDATMVAPGAMMNDEQSFNTDFQTEGTVTAFEDSSMSADDFANIMPAAGDAEEITDEAIIVADDAMDTMANDAMDAVAEAQDAMSANTMMETATDTVTETASDMVDTATEMASDAMDTAVKTLEPAAGAVNDAMTDSMAEDAANAVKDTASDAMDGAKDMMGY